MRNTVSYEWDYEIMDESGEEIVDHNHRDTLAEFTKEDITGPLVLIRNEGNENAGLTGRLWAYVYDGKLPEYFSDANEQETGYKVPAKFHTELSKYLNQQK